MRNPLQVIYHFPRFNAKDENRKIVSHATNCYTVEQDNKVSRLFS